LIDGILSGNFILQRKKEVCIRRVYHVEGLSIN